MEAIVALAGAGLLGSALMAVLASQSRFHAHNEDALHVEQTVRAFLDGMMAELRSASSADLLLATSDSVTIRFDVSRQVVCDTAPGGVAHLFAYDSVTAPNLPPGFRGTAVSGPYDANFQYADGFIPATNAATASETICRANGADPSARAPGGAFRSTNGWTARYGAAPERGSVVRTYGALTYSVAGSPRGTVSVRRNGQEFATPLAGGTRFEYGMTDGTTRARVAPGNLAAVQSVRLIATVIGRMGSSSARQLLLEAPFRN